MSAAASRRFAHDLVDLLFDHVEQIESRPVVEWTPLAELRELVRIDGERADSFSWDPHKLMWMPLSLGTILVRDGIWLRRAFEADEPELNILCFRRRGLDDERQAELRERLIRSGRAWITSTVLRGERVLRVTMMNPRITEGHIEAMLDALREV